MKAKVRILTGEVKKIAPDFVTFDDVIANNPTQFSIVSITEGELATRCPDGTDVRNPDIGGGAIGPMRELGWAKIYDDFTDPPNWVIRNATQAEIDAFVTGEESDRKDLEVVRAQELLELHPNFRRLLVAFASILVDEINILRQQHGLSDRTLAQLKTAIVNRISKDD